MTYDFKQVEKKWQDTWEKEGTFFAKDDNKKEKWYGLIEFPYPSGQGLHVGHPRSYTALDIVARKRRLQGYNVLYPIGFDAFGLPAENYAIKNKVHPKIVTQQNIANFTRQLKSIGFSFDWSRVINTTDPEYYKWSQWIFTKLYEYGLAYKTTMPINFCTGCKVGLANEEVVNGVCERCGSPVVQKEKSQWMLKITEYAQRLIDDLDEVDFLDKIKAQQKNWIGRSEGAEVSFKIDGEDKELTVYTTRPDTLFGATYMVVAPEHPIIDTLSHKITNMNEVEEYKRQASLKSDFERAEINKEKTGVELKGIKAINPVNGEMIPIWISDYVLITYGTGAIMAVPAHDQRDFEFATKFNIPIKQVIAPLFEDTGDTAPKPDIKTVSRNVAMVIVKHWSEDKYLCLDWKELGWKSFITGGIEENETAVEGALRELQEETGYCDIKSAKLLPFELRSNFYAAHKLENRKGTFKIIAVDLASDKQCETLEKDTKNHTYHWINSKDVAEYIDAGEHRLGFEMYNNPTVAYTDISSEKQTANANPKHPQIHYSIVIHSDFLDGLTVKEAQQKIIAYLEEKGIGTRKVNYKLRDWVFSRQRYWGEPIPMVYCSECGWVPVPEKDLPLVLPDVEDYEPGENGESPLARHQEWVNTTCPHCGKPAKRETDTMPQWAGSSWYYLRYMDPHNKEALASKEALQYWSPVDWYNGGMEHTTLHLLYSRFWHKFLYDIGVVPTKEPYQKRTSHGMILGSNGEKMSKSKGNVINPDDIVNEFGADTLRVYEMFMGPFDQTAAWSMDSIRGCHKFLDRVWNLKDMLIEGENYRLETEKMMHKAIKKVSEDIEEMKFNTSISTFMTMINEFYRLKEINRAELKTFLTLLNPFAPHITEELNEVTGFSAPISSYTWPEYDESKTIDDEIELPIQINGKVKGSIMISIDEEQDSIKEKVHTKVTSQLEGKNIIKEIYVKNKIYNIVIK